MDCVSSVGGLIRRLVIWTCAGVCNAAKALFRIVNPHMAGADIKAMEGWAV